MQKTIAKHLEHNEIRQLIVTRKNESVHVCDVTTAGWTIYNAVIIGGRPNIRTKQHYLQPYQTVCGDDDCPPYCLEALEAACKW